MKTWLARGVFVCLLALTPALANAESVKCDAKDGKGVVACVEKAFPERLVAGVSLAVREENAKFLRDRVIETARCAMLDVGLNLKRGGPSISVDFVAWKNGNQLEGVDIISGWDDTKKPLKLMWHRYDPPNFGHPFFKAFGPVVCAGAGEPTPQPQPQPVPVDPNPELVKKIAALELELSFHRQQLEAARKDVMDQLDQIHALQLVIAELERKQEALKQQAAEEAHRAAVLQNRLNNVTCRAAIFGIRVPCSVQIPE